MTTKSKLKRTERADRNLALKIILEQRFNPEVRTYLNKILKDYKTLYTATGNRLSVDSYKDETESLLKKQYKRVSNAFSKDLRNARTKSFFDIQTKVDEDEDESIISNLIAAALLLFQKKQSKQRAGLLDTTTDRDIRESTLEAVNEIMRSQVTSPDQDITPIPLTNSAIATLGASKLKYKFNARNKVIAMTETQFSAERVKFIEAAIIEEGVNSNINQVIEGAVIISVLLKKQWSSVLGTTTRDAHAAADGQRVKLSDPFIVGGEYLMHPSDSSLGASTGNTINCRCSSLYL